MKINFSEIKKLVGADKSLIVKEIGEGLIIKRADGSIAPDIQEIITILRQFGVKDSSFEIIDEGTLVESSSYNAQKLKMILAPFYKLGDLKIYSTWKLLLEGIYIVEEDLKSVPGSIDEDDGSVGDGSADDLGQVPNAPVSIGDTGNIEPLLVDDIANAIDSAFDGKYDIEIVDNNNMSISPVDDDIVDFIQQNPEMFANADVVISDDIITITL